jgi:hypothetical protein
MLRIWVTHIVVPSSAFAGGLVYWSRHPFGVVSTTDRYHVGIPDLSLDCWVCLDCWMHSNSIVALRTFSYWLP